MEKAHISSFKALRNPPAALLSLAKGVCLILGITTQSTKWDDPATDHWSLFRV